MRKGFLILLLLIGILLLRSGVYAQFEFEDESVEIEFEDEEYVEPTEIPSPTPTKIPVRDYILYDEQKKEFDERGYFVKKTLPYQKSPVVLETTLSSIKLDFTNLQPNIPSEKQVSFSVRGNNLFSYQTVVTQDKYLYSPNGLEIENTLCDIVKTPCNSTFARKWTKSEAGGFGYKVTGADRPLDFAGNNSYRIFPVLEKKEDPVTLFNSQLVQGDRTGAIYFKIIPPPSFQESTYTTEIKVLTYPKL